MAGYPANETGYPAGYRISKKVGYPAGRISGATLMVMWGMSFKLLNSANYREASPEERRG